MTSLILFTLSVLWILPCAVAFFLLLFFKTHFVVEYAELFRLGAFFKTDEFRAWETSNENLGYPVFLREQHNCFLTRLLGCPWCLSVWLSSFAGSLVGIAALHFLTPLWAAIFGYASSMSIGFTAMMLYVVGLKAYRSM